MTEFILKNKKPCKRDHYNELIVRELVILPALNIEYVCWCSCNVTRRYRIISRHTALIQSGIGFV